MSVSKEQVVDESEINRLRAIHPTSDLEALLRAPLYDPGPRAWEHPERPACLREILTAARSLYNRGERLHGRAAVTRGEMIEEVLRLRARFQRMTWQERAVAAEPGKW